MANLNYWNSDRTSYNITLSGILLALTLLFQYLSSAFFNVFGFLNINFSVIFILVLYLATNYKYTFLVLILRFIISPSFSSSGYSDIGIFGHFILLISDLLYLTFFILLHILFFKKISFNLTLNLIFSFSLATIINAFLMSVLNGLIFTPIYFFVLKFGTSASFTFYMQEQIWQNFQSLFFNTPNYWSGIFSLYMTFNIINFSLVTFLIVISTISLYKAKIINIKFYKDSTKKVKIMKKKSYHYR